VSFEEADELSLSRGLDLIWHPFSPGAWGLLLGAIFTMAVIFVVQEMAHQGSMFERSPDEPPDAAPTKETGTNLKLESAWQSFKSVVKTAPESVYFCFRSFLGGACELQAVTWGGRITILAFGVLIVVFLTVYQSALTTQMVNKQKYAKIDSIEEGIQLGMNFCAQRVTAEQIIRLYPAAHFTTDPSDGQLGLVSRSDVFRHMDIGLCDLGVAYGQDLEREHGIGQHCTKMLVGRPVATSSEGIPLAPAKAAALGWRLQKAINEGTWDAIKQRNRPQDICNSGEQQLAGQVRFGDMLGQTALFVTIAAVTAVYGAIMGTHRAVGAVKVAGASRVTAATIALEDTLQRTSSGHHLYKWASASRLFRPPRPDVPREGAPPSGVAGQSSGGVDARPSPLAA